MHLHARAPDGTPSYEVKDYQAIYQAVTAACPIVINFSTGAIGITTEQKIAPVRELKPALAALNMGSMNYAKYRPEKKDFVFEFVFPNPFSEIMTSLSQYLLGISMEPSRLTARRLNAVVPSMPLATPT